MKKIHDSHNRAKKHDLVYYGSRSNQFKRLLGILQRDLSKISDVQDSDEEEAPAHSKRPRTDNGEGLTAMLDIVEGLHRRVATLELGFV